MEDAFLDQAQGKLVCCILYNGSCGDEHLCFGLSPPIRYAGVGYVVSRKTLAECILVILQFLGVYFQVPHCCYYLWYIYAVVVIDALLFSSEKDRCS